MPKLASVLTTTDDTRPRGPDLHTVVEVPTHELGLSCGTVVRIPLELPHDGETIPRTPAQSDHGDQVRLHLPSDLPDGATLRLVGQGGATRKGRPGDLYVTVTLVARRGSGRLIWFLGGLSLGLLLWLLLRRML